MKKYTGYIRHSYDTILRMCKTQYGINNFKNRVLILFGGAALTLGARSWTAYTPLPTAGWLLIAAIVVLGTVVSFSLFAQGIHDAGPVRSSILSVTEPVSAAVLAFLWLGTEFTPADLIGFAAILATVFLLAKQE